MDGKVISYLDFGKHPVDGKFIVIFAKRTYHIVFMVAGCIFFS